MTVLVKRTSGNIEIVSGTMNLKKLDSPHDMM